MADRISVLPDAVICYILSFLPTKQSVATSVLSKRWMSLWRSVPTLHFFENTWNHTLFVQSVYKFILSRDLHQTIKTFSLTCISSLCYDNNINTWINAALQCGGVEHLDLCFDFTIELSSPILTHRTLVVLKLSGLDITTFSSVDLPSLKILQLSEIIFEESGYLAKLLSGCPLLEDLVAKNISFHDSPTDAEFKSVPKLVKADISKFILSEAVAVANVKFLHIDWSDDMDQGTNPSFKDLVLVFPNLIHIKFYNVYCPENLPKIVEVLKHCPKLQTLVIDHDGFSEDDEEGGGKWPYPQSVPESISLQLKTCSVNNYEGSNGQFRFARYILRNARFLQFMTICTFDTNPHAKLKMLKKLSLCPRCSTTCKLSFE
ncbi:putative F-box/FBD/LRR-repeat protein At5g22670 isoform X1 [Gastrolobium bilobum]|uniref:putative F-box/FBD/LRR-repeat protein At5g22670 isoform X1 n=1 Tax=Gastrolobium bilobum TaxID=150636 RepID=UPI002AB086C4|nr:putative F-box/FBD/LRR-repeat protein At5g22670 isoform X1 [Gastrolobium bilobum]